MPTDSAAGAGISGLSEMTDYDVVIVGGGMVGSMLAAALATHSDLKLAVLEQREPEPFEPGSSPEYDTRVSALSIATQRMFENVGAWQGVLDRRACPYRKMLVWDGEQGGSTHFDSAETGSPELGHIVENRVVQLALLDKVKSAATVDYLCPSHLQGFHCYPDRIVCRLSTQQSEASQLNSLSTRLLVGADGANSIVRELANIAMARSTYPQQALVATIETELPQQDITWQRFKPTGPEAFLPLCGSRASMVWYNTPEEVDRLNSLSADEFISALQDTFPDRLGAVRKVLARGSFPIAKAHAQSYISDRVALIGDAAHTVHPLAGQGVNLGMLDAAALAEVLGKARVSGKDIGSRRVLRQYERWRQGDNAIMISILDGFYHAFKPQPRPFRVIRSGALSVADNAGALKKLVMHYAMGKGDDLPQLAR